MVKTGHSANCPLVDLGGPVGGWSGRQVVGEEEEEEEEEEEFT